MKSKLKGILKNILNPQTSSNPKGRFVEHVEGEVFNQNPQFQMLLDQIANFQANGLFKTHIDKKHVVGKNGFIKIDEKTAYHITALIFGDNEKADRYIELRHDGHMLGFGNVWEMADEGKQIFMFENKETTGFPINLVSVIKVPKPNALIVDFYTQNGEWLGFSIGAIKKQNKKMIATYNYVLKKTLFGKQEQGCLAFSGAKTKEELIHPLILLKDALKANQVSQKSMDENSAFRSRNMLYREKEMEM